MKKKDLTSLKSKSTQDLVKLVEQKRVEASALKVKTFAGQEKNLKASKNLKKEIARILTLIGQKEIISKASEKEGSEK